MFHEIIPCLSLKNQLKIILNDLYFHIVKGHCLYERILVKSAFGVTLEIPHGVVQPYGFGQVHLVAGLFNCIHDLVGPGVGALVADHRVLNEMVVINESYP